MEKTALSTLQGFEIRCIVYSVIHFYTHNTNELLQKSAYSSSYSLSFKMVFSALFWYLLIQGGAIIRQLRRNVENIGFDIETGLLLSHRPKPLPEFSDNKIIKEGKV